ncbi:MAG: hypothetical protein INR71_01630, partial [Terriglobus roseus]|nr:hypothetical protein [Terriglobus roseus]
DDEDGEDESRAAKAGVRTKYDRMFERQNQDVLSSHYSKLVRDEFDDNSSNGDDSQARGLNGEALDDDSGVSDAGFLSVKRRVPAPPSTTTADAPQPRLVHIDGAAAPLLVDSKRREKLLLSRKKLAKLKDKGVRTVFDDEGVAHPAHGLGDEAAFRAGGAGAARAEREDYAERERARIEGADGADKEEAKRKRKEKVRKRKERERAEAMGESVGAGDGDEGENQAYEDFMRDAEGVSGEEHSGDEEAPQLMRREKKWFEDDDEDDGEKAKSSRKGKRRRVERDAPETLEDLEEIAMGLLG